MALKINKLLAKELSYGNKRRLDDVKYIVIHYTGNQEDTAKGNCKYFAGSNTRQAGAHFFVDRSGEVWKSVNVSRTAWAVGGFYTQAKGAGKYYKKCTNANSVSIELCDLTSKSPSWEQLKACRQLTDYIQKHCPNAKTVIRHWDVNGKACPATMTGKENEQWKRLHNYVTKGYQYKAKVTTKAAMRSSGKAAGNNKIGTFAAGQTIYIAKTAGNWGRLKGKSADGNYRWITLSKVKEL